MYSSNTLRPEDDIIEFHLKTQTKSFWPVAVT